MKIETFIKSGDVEIQNQKFHQHKRAISIKNININKIVVSNKVSFRERDLIISLVIMMLKK